MGNLCFILTILVTFFSGCGGEVYRERVEATTHYFRRLEDRNQLLSKDVWNSESISFRVPLRFVPFLDENNAPRPPLPLDVPGLLGSWKGRLSLEKTATEKDAFLYLADSQRASDEDKKIGDFEQTSIERIATTLGIEPKTILQSRTSTKFPNKPGVVDQVEYVFYRFEIPDSIANFEEAYQAYLFFHKATQRKILILFLIPKDLSSDSKQRTRRALSFSLESLVVREQL